MCVWIPGADGADHFHCVTIYVWRADLLYLVEMAGIAAIQKCISNFAFSVDGSNMVLEKSKEHKKCAPADAWGIIELELSFVSMQQ